MLQPRKLSNITAETELWKLESFFEKPYQVSIINSGSVSYRVQQRDKTVPIYDATFTASDCKPLPAPAHKVTKLWAPWTAQLQYVGPPGRFRLGMNTARQTRNDVAHSPLFSSLLISPDHTLACLKKAQS